MTCEDFRAKAPTFHPYEATVAERAAIAGHARNCRECAIFLRDYAMKEIEEGLAELPDHVRDTIKIRSMIRAVAQIASDSQDGEYREVVQGNQGK